MVCSLHVESLRQGRTVYRGEDEDESNDQRPPRESEAQAQRQALLQQRRSLDQQLAQEYELYIPAPHIGILPLLEENVRRNRQTHKITSDQDESNEGQSQASQEKAHQLSKSSEDPE